MMYTNSLIEYIKLIVLKESKLREAEISGDKRVPWGCDEHVSDLQNRISEAEYWKNKCPRGSEKRAHWRGVINSLKNELKSASKRNQALNEKDD